MLSRSKILLLIPHLGGGGAERVIAQLARSLPRDCFDVHLGLVTQKYCSPEILPASVRVHGIGAKRVLFGALGLVRLVRRLRPDLIISGVFHLNFLVLLLRPFFPRKTRILIRQNGMLQGELPQPMSGIETRLYRATYPRADGIICQTDAMAKEMTGLLGSGAGIRVLRNPVDVRGIRQVAERTPRHWLGGGPHLLAVGRLSPEKGFDLLIEAFSIVRAKFPSADLIIIGKGLEGKALQTRCDLLKLNGCVRFMGFVTDPASWFGEATLLVIPSRQEGFPNILLEGASAGLPIVTTPCSPAVTELLHGQAGAWLTGNVSSAALANSILAALDTLRPGERFRHSWLEPFDLPNSVTEYEFLIQETLAGAAQ